MLVKSYIKPGGHPPGWSPFFSERRSGHYVTPCVVVCVGLSVRQRRQRRHNHALDAILAELKDDLDIPGFDEELLSDMMADASDVTDKIREYGTLDESEIEELKEAKERKERYMASGIDGGGEPAGHDTAQPKQGESVGRYVTCPHCGEKVWL